MRIYSYTTRFLATRFVVLASLAGLLACNKTISNVNKGLAPLDPTNEDLNAGTWKLVLLSRPDTFAVAVPAATNTTAYAADLNQIKGYQHNLTSDQRGEIL